MVFTAHAVNTLNEILTKMSNSKALKSFRTRARNIPSMMMTTGLPQTLAFLASKADSSYYEYLAIGTKKPNKGEEEAGYAAYLYAIMKFLNEGVGAVSSMPRSIREVMEIIRKIDERPDLGMTIHSLLMEYLLELKKVAEALIEEE